MYFVAVSNHCAPVMLRISFLYGDAAAIAPGARADLVVLDGAAAALYGRRGDAVLDSWIFAAAASPIDRVYASGRRVVEHGRHVSRDRHDAAFKAGVRLCGPFAWRDRPDFTCFQAGSETAAIARGVAAELGPLANTQPKPEVGPYAVKP